MEQNPPVLDPIISSIESTQKAIYFLSGLNIFLILVFAEIVCLYRDICHISLDIDIPAYASHSFLPLLLITLLLTMLFYESSEFIHINYLGPLRIIVLVYSILMIGYTVGEFVAGMILADTDRTDTWNNLTPLAQSYYDNSISNLNSTYRINMIIVCLFQLINAVLLLGCGIAVWVLYSKTPTGYLPRPKFVAIPKEIVEKQAENKLFDNSQVEEYKLRDEQIEDSRFGQNISEDDGDHPLAPSYNPFLRQLKP